MMLYIGYELVSVYLSISHKAPDWKEAGSLQCTWSDPSGEGLHFGQSVAWTRGFWSRWHHSEFLSRAFSVDPHEPDPVVSCGGGAAGKGGNWDDAYDKAPWPSSAVYLRAFSYISHLLKASLMQNLVYAILWRVMSSALRSANLCQPFLSTVTMTPCPPNWHIIKRNEVKLLPLNSVSLGLTGPSWSTPSAWNLISQVLVSTNIWLLRYSNVLKGFIYNIG